MTTIFPDKPLGAKAYGSIPHLPGSRRGPADRGLTERQAQILTHKARDKHDHIIVQEKLDGTNVAVARIDGAIVPLIRAGYPAISSHYEQHRMFANWAFERQDVFMSLLEDGERICGEWLAQAHGTRYSLTHDPFVAFDLMRGTTRALYADFVARMRGKLVHPAVIHAGGPLSIGDMLPLIATSRHGAIDPVEGAVWRCERRGLVDFLGKYVRPEKVDGCYLNSVTGTESVWNWRPA